MLTFSLVLKDDMLYKTPMTGLRLFETSISNLRLYKLSMTSLMLYETFIIGFSIAA